MTPGLGQAEARTQVEGQAQGLRGARSQVLLTLPSSPWLKLRVSSCPDCSLTSLQVSRRPPDHHWDRSPNLGTNLEVGILLTKRKVQQTSPKKI